MSVFDAIKSKIFGHKADVGVQPTAVGGTQPAAMPETGAASQDRDAASLQASSDVGVAPQEQGQPKDVSPVDVSAVLTDMASKSSQTLNWRESIVDLMKLLDLDSSLGNRKQLAHELGYTGNSADSASMNIWLHNQVMRKLAENGGRVSADLLRS